MSEHSKLNTGRNRKESGLTLIEVLIASAVLGILAAAFLSALGGGLKSTVLADERTVAESLARSQMEAIRNAEYDDTDPYEYAKITDIPTGYDVNPDDAAIPAILWNPETGEPSDPTDLGFQRIIVTVYHNDDFVLQVETYKEER